MWCFLAYCSGGEGPPSPPLRRGASSANRRAVGAAAFELRHFRRVPNAPTAVEQAAPPSPSLEKLGWISASQWPVGQIDAPPLGCSETAQKASKHGPRFLGP